MYKSRICKFSTERERENRWWEEGLSNYELRESDLISCIDKGQNEIIQIIMKFNVYVHTEHLYNCK